jgi:hypothetical protein
VRTPQAQGCGILFSLWQNKERGKGVKRNIRKTDPQKSLYKTPYRFLFILNCIFLTGKRP